MESWRTKSVSEGADGEKVGGREEVGKNDCTMAARCMSQKIACPDRQAE